MSAKPNDGGPAFPGIEGMAGYGNSTCRQTPSGDMAWTNHNQGMNLRDWFAGMALQGLLASGHYTHFNKDDGPDYRRECE